MYGPRQKRRGAVVLSTRQERDSEDQDKAFS